MRYRIFAVALAATALLSAACGSKDTGGAIKSSSNTTAAGGSGTTAAGSDLFSKLPASIQQAKEVKIGTDASYAPNEFFKSDGTTIQGMDFDMGQALAQKLGVKATFTNSQFDGLIPALTAKRFDMLMSSMTDNKTRQASVDFVDYFTAGTAILVQKGNPQKINSLDDLCGKTVGLERGTIQEDAAKEQAAKCKTDGKAELKVLSLDKDTDALQQLKLGRTQADMNDFPVAAYNAETSSNGNDFEVVGQQFGSGPYGIAIAKDNTQLRDAVQAALKAIIADGTYDKVLTTWKVTQGALKTATVNAGS
ncbi:MAG: polar amino acid transport system substrate-binding protein [Acidimicrobiaceae bacterium]|jgi:polar amino acid transport system substrate-binding protein|nr:polar amino acid transport system substrate-binding protein [Acidimicrobiaceae bacterium]